MVLVCEPIDLQLAAPCLESPWLPELVSGPEVAGMALSAKNKFSSFVLQFFLFFPNFFFVRRIFLLTMNILVSRRNLKMNFPTRKNFKIFFEKIIVIIVIVSIIIFSQHTSFYFLNSRNSLKSWSILASVLSDPVMPDVMCRVVARHGLPDVHDSIEKHAEWSVLVQRLRPIRILLQNHPLCCCAGGIFLS